MGNSITIAYSLTLYFMLSALLLAACSPGGQAPARESKMEITSPAFQEGEAIPVRYSCEGENVSPELNWSGVPEGTRSFVLILDDPDSIGIFTHWVIFNIPADSRGLPEAVPGESQLADGTLQGKTTSARPATEAPARHQDPPTVISLPSTPWTRPLTCPPASTNHSYLEP